MSTYTREMVEQLIPTIWNAEAVFGVPNPYAPDPDMPKAKANPKTANTLYAHLADIQVAWKRTPLVIEQRRAVFMHYGLDLNYAEIGREEGVTRSTAMRRTEVGVGRLVDHLNGDAYEDVNDCGSERDGSDTDLD